MSDSPAYRGKWLRVRREVLARDGHRCQLGMTGCTGEAECVDHIVPILNGGAWWDPTNLRASCRHCNNARIDRRRGTAPEVTRSHASRRW